MVHFVSTQPGRETMNRVPRSCWQQRSSVRVPLLVPTASPLAASYDVFLSVRTRALRLSLSLSLFLSLRVCKLIRIFPKSSSKRATLFRCQSLVRYPAARLSALLSPATSSFLLAEPARRTQCPAKSFVLHRTCSLLHRIGSEKAITSSQRWRA